MAKPETPKKPAGAASAPEPPVKAPAATAQLPLPQVLHAIANSTLPPMTSTNGTAVIITAAVASGAQITVFWAIKGKEDRPVFTATAEGNGSAGVRVPVPAWVVGFCIAQTLTIWYQVGSNSSLRLELTVEVIPPDKMPEPVFTDLVPFQGSLWLDMSKFPGNAGVELRAWPFIAAGQRLWVEVVGNEHLPQRRFHWICENHVVTEEEAQQDSVFLLEILREWLAGNDDWSSVTIHAGFTPDGADGTPPVDPAISLIPANALEMRRATANLRKGKPELDLLQPKLREAVWVEGQGYVLNPALTVGGGHIEVTYDGMKPGDQVCVKFEGTPGLGSPAPVCQDVQDGDTKLVFTVPALAFSANFDSVVVISYTVLRDRLWPSQKLTVQVLEPVGLSGIDVEERTDGKLCLNTFPGPANATVARWDYAAPGQFCWMWIVGESEDGTAIHRDILVAEPVKREWVTDGVSTELAREELEKLADCGDFVVCFSVNFQNIANKAKARPFRPLQLEMVQADLKLPAPKVLEADGNHLTAWNGRNGVTVRVAYDGMSTHHTIALCWEQAGVCLALASKPGDITLGYVEFDIPRAAVIHGIGKTVPIRFSVSSRCRQQTSPDLGLEISRPVRLTTVQVVEATPPNTPKAVLDIRTFSGHVHVEVPNWWFIRTNQRGWLECTGALWDGSMHTIKVMSGEPINVPDGADGLVRVIERQALEAFETNTLLTFTFKVTADGSADVTKAIAFVPLELIFRKRLYDQTSFDPNERGWNGWQRGMGATDPRDLALRYGAYPWGNGYWLLNWGYTDPTDPVTQSEMLFKRFTLLEPGQVYEFHAWVRDDNGVPNAPLLALTVDGVAITPVVAPDTTWQILRGSFTASSANARLGFENRRMGAGPGNDFRVTWIRVFEV